MSNSIEKDLADLLKSHPKTIRFYALRMIMELGQGKQMTPEDQRRLYDISSKRKVGDVFR